MSYLYQNNILAIHDSLMLFYTIGGTILICLAGMWGFSKIIHLLVGKEDYYGEIDDIDESERHRYRFK